MGLPLAGTHRPGSLHLFFTKLFSKFATAQWADRVVGPYRVSANPYYPANFERKTDLQQPFKGSCL